MTATILFVDDEPDLEALDNALAGYHLRLLNGSKGIRIQLE